MNRLISKTCLLALSLSAVIACDNDGGRSRSDSARLPEVQLSVDNRGDTAPLSSRRGLTLALYRIDEGRAARTQSVYDRDDRGANRFRRGYRSRGYNRRTLATLEDCTEIRRFGDRPAAVADVTFGRNRDGLVRDWYAADTGREIQSLKRGLYVACLEGGAGPGLEIYVGDDDYVEGVIVRQRPTAVGTGTRSELALFPAQTNL